MPMNWRIVEREHVIEACELILGGKLERKLRGRSLFVLHSGQRLPAKDVARTAYLLAQGKDPESFLDFSSGQRILDLFKELGFEVERQSGPQGSKQGIG